MAYIAENITVETTEVKFNINVETQAAGTALDAAARAESAAGEAEAVKGETSALKTAAELAAGAAESEKIAAQTARSQAENARDAAQQAAADVLVAVEGYVKKDELASSEVRVTRELVDYRVGGGSVWRSDTGDITNISGSGYPNACRSEELIPVKPGEKYLYTGEAGFSYGIGGYNSDRTFTSRILDSSNFSLYPGINNHINTEITIPPSVFFVGVSSRTSTLSFLQAIDNSLGGFIKQQEDSLLLFGDEIDSVKTDVGAISSPSKNLIDQSLIVYGIYSSSGVLGSSVNSVVTPLIPIEASKGFLSLNKNMTLGVTHRFLFYNADKGFISSVARGNEQGFAIPSNAAFVAVNITSVTGGIGDPTSPTNTYTGDLQLEYGEQSTTFESFGPKIKQSSLPDSLAKSHPIKVVITDANNFTVRSLHDNGEAVDHTWTRVNKATQHDIGWYAPDIRHKGNNIVQGSFNWIHMTAFPNENQHVGHGHGCETDLEAEFYIDGQRFIPSEVVGKVLEGDIFSFNIRTEIYAADSANTPDGSNVVPQLPLIVSTRHYMIGEILPNSIMKYKNKLVIMRDGTTFSRCYIAMQDARLEYFDRLQINNIENSMNSLSESLPTFTVIPPSTATFNGVSYNTSDGFRAELASSAIAYSDRFGYIFKTEVLDINQDPDKMYIQTAGTGKIYFHPVVTTQIASRAGVPADVFNKGDVIEGTVIRQLIL